MSKTERPSNLTGIPGITDRYIAEPISPGGPQRGGHGRHLRPWQGDPAPRRGGCEHLISGIDIDTNVPIFGRRWEHDWLALGPPGTTRVIRGRSADPRKLRLPSRRMDQLWNVGRENDANEKAMARSLEGIRPWSKVVVAIQLGHAGCKASGTTMARRGSDIQRCSQWLAYRSAVGACLPSWRGAARRSGRCGLTRTRQALCRIGRANRAPRFRRGADSHGAWLFATSVSFAALQSSRGRIWQFLESRIRFPAPQAPNSRMSPASGLTALALKTTGFR